MIGHIVELYLVVCAVATIAFLAFGWARRRRIGS
jgi:hypothetical protein